jgi:hypothetical protein
LGAFRHNVNEITVGETDDNNLATLLKGCAALKRQAMGIAKQDR